MKFEKINSKKFEKEQINDVNLKVIVGGGTFQKTQRLDGHTYTDYVHDLTHNNPGGNNDVEVGPIIK